MPVNLRAQKRILTTTICSNWTGSSSVTGTCPNNAGLAQHELKIVPSATADVGCISVWLRPLDCGYWVRFGYLRLDVGRAVLRGLFDAVRLDVATPWTGVLVTATVASIGTTFNSSASEDDETLWRRRYLHHPITVGWDGSGSASGSATSQAPLSQHILTVGGGQGTLYVYGMHNGMSPVQLGTVDSGGGLLLFTGYYDSIKLTPSLSASGSINADLFSIGQELLIDESGQTSGSPQIVQDGDVGIINDGRSMLWSSPGEIIENGSLRIDGAFMEQ